jgi:hypothetical protein
VPAAAVDDAAAAAGGRRTRAFRGLRRLRGKSAKVAAKESELDDQSVHGANQYPGADAKDDLSLHGTHAHAGARSGGGGKDDESVHGAHAYGSLAGLADAQAWRTGNGKFGR